MGIKGGPTAQTPAQKKARGQWVDARAERATPKPDPGKPKQPAHLSSAAKTAWKRVLPLLETQNTLAKIDGEQLARYCDLVAKYWRCSQFLEKHGDTYETTTQSGDTMIRPYPQAANMLQYDTALRRTEARFGMTPADRVSIGLAIGETKRLEAKAAKDAGDNILECGI